MLLENKFFLLLSVVTASVLYANDNTLETELEDMLSTKTELKADIGSRSGSTNTFNSSTPIDVITCEQIENSGLTSLTEVMRYFITGFNAPDAPSMTDGSDHVRMFTLRGMNPDQILVLVNGKRLHTSALLHINGTIGRGSSNVDLDTIPLNAIERVEILRDGAAAQYGSDAISGVINIILKGVGHSNRFSAVSGMRASGDGQQYYSDLFITKPLKYDGFMNISLSAKDQEHTNHAGIDSRTGVTPPRVTTKLGIPDSQNILAALNLEAPQDNDLIFYTNASFNYRDSKANAFYRVPSASNASLYPDGFLPIINANIFDFSNVIGVRGEYGDLFKWDLSNTYGFNTIDFSVDNTMNYSYGAQSPTSMDNGGLDFTQNTTNLDLEKKIGAFTLAGGAEYRYENYKIIVGEEASYNVGAITTEEGGTQGLKGYRPENSVDASRNSYALYLDGKYNITDDLLINAAARHENFNDFGSTSNVKVALGYNITSDILLRSSASTGFRAPSLAQSNYSYTSTYDQGGILKTTGIFKPSDEVSKAFGAQPLKPETSKHFAFGTVYKPSEATSLMVDYFYTAVDDKIMLSNPFGASATPAQQAILDANGVYRASFFTNAVNMKTQGVDIKFNHKFLLDNSDGFDFGLWYNYNQNKVVGFNNPDITRANSFREIDRLENGQPQSSLKILNSYSNSLYDATLNINRYGSYCEARGDVSYTFDPTWTVDVDIAYKFSKDIIIAIGGNNIFDTMPSTWDGLSGAGSYYGSNGIIPYSLYSPIGHSGAYYYLRTVIKF